MISTVHVIQVTAWVVLGYGAGKVIWLAIRDWRKAKTAADVKATVLTAALFTILIAAAATGIAFI
jgi:hypothetical protein